MKLENLRQKIVKKEESEVATFINDLYRSSADKFLKYQRQWYINQRFYKGDHWIVYNKTVNKIQVLPAEKGEIRRTVNKIKSQVRGVKNFVKRNQPRWEVQPNDITDEAQQEALKYNKLLQNFYETRNFPGHLTDVLVNSLLYSVGILELGIVKKEGENYFDAWINDTFDITFDPSATCLQDCRFIIKSFKKSVSDIEEKYKVKVIADNKQADSDYKDLLLKEKLNNSQNNNLTDLDTAIVRELWIKWFDGEKNVIKVIASCDKKFLREYITPYKRYPLFIYNPEKTSNSIYSDAWIMDLISPNKSLDKMASQIETYITRMLTGKYLIKKGTDLSVTSDRQAEKLEYDGNTKPEQMNLQPLPSTPFNYLSTLERWIEEFGGVREASLGRAPGSIQSGKAIEALQSADAGVVSEPVENLQIFLKEIAEFILEVISNTQIASHSIVQKNEKIKYIGSIIPKENTPEDTIRIEPRTVKVVIVPEIAYSEMEKRDVLMQLASNQLIDPQTVLEKLSISNVGEIIERMKKNKSEQFKQEMVKQKESHRSSGEAPEDTADLANQENMQMAAGQSVPMTPQALWTPDHTELHMAFIQENKDAYQQQQQVFDEHIQNEQQYQ